MTEVEMHSPTLRPAPTSLRLSEDIYLVLLGPTQRNDELQNCLKHDGGAHEGMLWKVRVTVYENKRDIGMLVYCERHLGSYLGWLRWQIYRQRWYNNPDPT